MIDDSIARTDTGETPAIPPVWEEPRETQAEAEAEALQSAVPQIREEARAQSKNWTVIGRKAFSPVLEKKRQKAARAILGSPLKISVRDRKVPAQASQLVANNQRLLRSSSLDIRTAIRSKVTFPLVRIGAEQGEVVPRAYVAAEDISQHYRICV